MSRTKSPFRTSSCVWLLAAAAVAGCSDSSGPGRAVTPEEAEVFGQTVASEVETTLNSLLAGELLSLVEAGGTTLSVRPRLDGVSLAGIADPVCPTPSQDPIIDTDEDGVPNDVTYNFTLPACSSEGEGISVSITGSLRLIDDTPQTAGFGYDATFNNLRISFTGEEGSLNITRGGIMSVSVNADQLTLTQGITTTVTGTDIPATSVVNTVGATFVAAEGSELVVGEPLPDGTFSPSSSITVNSDGATAVFTLSTQTPLQFDAECFAEGAFSAFSAGEIRASIVTSEGSGYVRITFAECGEPAVVFVGTNQ